MKANTQFPSILQLFQTLTTFSPRTFQHQTITRILNRQDTILRAPTGSGKTETAIAPFLFAKTLNLDFPNKLIYIVPLRTLANSLRQRTSILVRRWEAIYKPSRPLVVTLQTGENPEDPRFEGDIIFCTIDQLLSSFLNIPYSVGRGSANVNAGVVFSSYLVFDELHLLDPQRSFATVMKLLEQIKGISPFLLMTATLTDELAANMVEISDKQASFIQVSDTDLVEIEGQRQRNIYAENQALTAQVIWDDIKHHQRQRVIVICNTVSQAQGIYRNLDELNSDNQLNITLLHSRFLPKHRAEKENCLQVRFKNNWVSQSNGICDILIATQVIEVGLNITCEVMHTQLSPMNSLLQRAGRCARFEGEVGKVFVYRSIEVIQEDDDWDREDLEVDLSNDVESEDNAKIKKRQFLPYDDKICELTWEVLQNHEPSAPVTFRVEESWINLVHKEENIIQAKRRENNQGEFEKQFNKAIFVGDKSVADDLIRYIDSRNIFVWEEPSFIDFVEQPIDPKKLVAFSIPTPTLCGIWREYQNREYKTDWLFKRIEIPKKKAESYSQPVTMHILSNSDLINSFRILVNPKYLKYDEHIGLRFGIDIQGNGFTSPNQVQKLLASEYQYHMDNYIQHLGFMCKCWYKPFPTTILLNGELVKIQYGSVKDELLQAGGRFIQSKIFPNETLEKAEILFEYLVLLAIFTHDLGKLQIKWQTVMRGWQEIAHHQFEGKNPKTHLIAHTDYNPENKQQRQALQDYEKQHKRPPHAVESAFLANYILQQSLAPFLQQHFYADPQQKFDVAYAVMMAAGRHHSAFTKGWGTKEVGKGKKLELHPEADSAIAQSWLCLTHFFPKTLSLPPTPSLTNTSYPIAEFPLNKLSPYQIAYLQLYSLVVRALRLCDMRSVQLPKGLQESVPHNKPRYPNENL